tara:strand:- start:3556 stop:4008 length:453 start_codon:yes stop_codon:yes gene_type:complete
MVDSNRITRELDSRTQAERPKQWQPASTLPLPDKQPGYDYRWVRVSSLGQSDPRNVSAKRREGWEPVMVEEQPQFKTLVDANSRFKDNIEIGGLLLCKIPTAFMDQRRAYYADKNQQQIDSVDNNFMKENNPKMPLFADKRSSASFGKGK